MMKYLMALFIVGVFGSCTSTKKIVSTPAVKDSVSTIVSLPDAAAIDSLNTIRLNVQKIHRNKINFSSFSSRVKMDYDGGNQKYTDITAFVRIKKDSVIWISLNAVLGIEAVRILITPDTVKVLDKLNRTYQTQNFNFLQEVTKLPVDFFILQDLLMGNPVFMEDSVFATARDERFYQIATIGRIFKNISDFLQPDLLISRSRLLDTDSSSTRSAQLDYGGYEITSDKRFSTLRKISVIDKKLLNVALEFKQVVFDNPVNFPFAIPGNYKLK